MTDRNEAVRVVVRIRPMSSKEMQDARTVVAVANSERAEVKISNPKSEKESKTFTFDSTYGADATQKQIYDITASPIVDSVLQGFNGTIFAYGQTGAGKSHTMEGLADPPDMRGIIPNSFKHIFDRIHSNHTREKQFLARASYLEIYNEEVRDLLSKDPTNRLELKENADHEVYVKDLTTIVVKSAGEMDAVLQAGKKNRQTGATLMNQTSSRSHSVFTITVETSEVGSDGESHIRVGKLNLVDLAGSERQSKTGATGQRLKEATKINLSLTALGNVISALVDGKSTHVPYRDSKLTRLLQDSLGGNTKTIMIANCGPADYNYDETLTTLRYADRAKQIKNKPRINEDPKDAMLREFQEEIARLRARLAEEEARAKQTTTVMIDGKAVNVPSTQKDMIIVEKIKGVSDEEVRALQEKANKERAEILARAEEERRQILMAAAKTDEERRKIEAQLSEQQVKHEKAVAEKSNLESQLQAMQEKLLMGGQVLDKAARQEEELRKAQVELEERRRQEASLARELEEANVMIEEQYASMAEELEAKTRKLKKVWNKLQSAQSEIRDLSEEFQKEREDMLDTIRELNKTLKLKQLLLDSFVPVQDIERLESRAVWDDTADEPEWTILRFELAGNRMRVRRPPSVLTNAHETLFGAMPMPDARPTSQFAIAQSQSDPDPRYRPDNVAAFDLEWLAGTTKEAYKPVVGEKLNIERDVRAVMEVPEEAGRGAGAESAALGGPKKIKKSSSNKR
jgi:hypothetical protein